LIEIGAGVHPHQEVEVLVVPGVDREA